MQTVPREKLQEYIGKELPPSEWLTIDQDRINSFAETTLDHQYIHVDPAKAAKTPFGTTIAHGYLTLSLISHFLGQCGVGPAGAVMAINYGSDKVRFVQPVKVGSRVRARARATARQDRRNDRDRGRAKAGAGCRDPVAIRTGWLTALTRK